MHLASKILIEIVLTGDSIEQDLWPDDIETWVDLPGIGLTTAASIISSAFDHTQAILDGNVRRNLARLFGIQAILSDHR